MSINHPHPPISPFPIPRYLLPVTCYLLPVTQTKKCAKRRSIVYYQPSPEEIAQYPISGSFLFLGFGITISGTGELRYGRTELGLEVAMNIFQRVWDSIGFGEQFDDAEYDYEYGDEEYMQDPTIQDQPMMPRERSAPPASNVIGMPNRANGISEVVILQPHSFEEIPQAVRILRERKSVILNMMLMDPDQAQRSVDFVAGGVFAIDGHQERLGENIFLFTPNVVQITAQSAAQPIFNPPMSVMPPSNQPSMSHIAPTIAHPNQFRTQ